MAVTGHVCFGPCVVCEWQDARSLHCLTGSDRSWSISFLAWEVAPLCCDNVSSCDLSDQLTLADIGEDGLQSSTVPSKRIAAELFLFVVADGPVKIRKIMLNAYNAYNLP